MQCPELKALAVSNCTTKERFVGTQVTCTCPGNTRFENGQHQFTAECSALKKWSVDYSSCESKLKSKIISSLC